MDNIFKLTAKVKLLREDSSQDMQITAEAIRIILKGRLENLRISGFKVSDIKVEWEKK